VGQSPTSPNIDPGGLVTPFPVDGDEDWYEFRPQFTSTYQVRILFDRVLTLANGRAGLPGNGDLDLQIYDANGGLITTGVADGNGNNRTATFGATNTVAQFARIFIRVRGASLTSINVYDFENLVGVVSNVPGVSDVDNVGPQVTSVQITTAPAFDIFNPKPSAAGGPTPQFSSMTINFRDLPPRAPGFLYTALDPVTASNPGQYVVIGDNSGNIPVFSVTVINDPPVLGLASTGRVILGFDDPSTAAIESLPDDRFTLIVRDTVLDPATNKADGETNTVQPLETPLFPSGDDQQGGDFVARFTVDSRPELAVYCFGGLYIDLNGNLVFDTVNKNNDQVNADKVFLFATKADALFAGDFTNGGAANGFDKAGAYGRIGGVFRFFLDTNDDGVPDLTIVPTLQINGLPIAGDFNPARPGDEIGIFDGTTWFLDTNGNNNIDLGDAIFADGLTGRPIVGDFDGNGQFDLATMQPDNNVFLFHLNPLGAPNVFTSIAFGFPGTDERPVAADMDNDGVTDIGLFYIDGNGATPDEDAEWFFLQSGFRPPIAGTVNTLNHPFDPAPFGTDLYAQFGNRLGVPLVGNFDPPVAGTGAKTNSTVQLPEMVASASNPAKKDLVITGTVIGEAINVTRTTDLQSVQVTMNGLDLGRYPLDQINRIVVFGKGGDDVITIDPSITLGAMLNGGKGADELHAGGGNSILLGMGGADKLYGSLGRDLLIGGGGADQLFGGGEQDLLIGAKTLFDKDAAALTRVMAEWTSFRDLSSRIANIQGTGSGDSFAARLNGSTFLRGSGAGATVVNDATVDVLDGQAGPNWFFAKLEPVGDLLNDAILGALASDVKTKIG
jgi:hypothetical protein